MISSKNGWMVLEIYTFSIFVVIYHIVNIITRRENCERKKLSSEITTAAHSASFVTKQKLKEDQKKQMFPAAVIIHFQEECYLLL